MRKLYLAAILLMLAAINTQAAEENKIWYFGNQAGLDFNFDPPKAINSSEMFYAHEGCGVVCDTSGALMFYTNGEYIWNRNHDIMPNSVLRSHGSATQNGVVVSDPGNVNLCYVFTNGAQEGGGNSGFRYSIVDMTMESGLGDVSVPNEILLERSSEKIAVARHSDNTNYWVATHDYLEGKLMVWPVTAEGIGDPVISDLGHEFNLNLTWNRAGYMTFSPDYSKVALALYYTQTFILYDFDNTTGQISNPIVIQSTNGDYRYCYGIEFSPDASKLYVTRAGTVESSIYQFDISFGSLDDIVSSRVTLGTSPDNSNDYCALMLAPDNKIYVASMDNGYLHRINNPNESGAACDFVENAIYLEGKQSRKGLPTRAIAVPAVDTSSTEPDDTTKVEGLNPAMSFDCGTDVRQVPGERIYIGYELDISEEILASGFGNTVEATIQLDKYLLTPVDDRVFEHKIVGDLREITFRDTLSDHVDYKLKGALWFLVGLGKQVRTDIVLTALTVNDIVYDVDTLEISNGCFYTIVCEEGGTRLLNPVGQVLIMNVYPNPAGDVMKIDIELVEKGQTVMFMANLLGSRVANLFDFVPEKTGKQTLSFNTDNIASGLYYLVLKTPTQTKTTLVNIVK